MVSRWQVRRVRFRALTEFYQEVTMLQVARLHHMSLLNFRGVVLSLDEKCPLLIVTELADCSLQQWLNTLENPLTAAQVVVVDLWLQLSQALSFLHSQSPPIVAVVHRDIKPDNVLGFKNAGP
jgi:serine/threonine protein kinase